MTVRSSCILPLSASSLGYTVHPPPLSFHYNLRGTIPFIAGVFTFYCQTLRKMRPETQLRRFLSLDDLQILQGEGQKGL